jgi:RNA polymerase sigma factor (sigma-70 family)
MDCAHLISACAGDTGGGIIWREFLKRYSSKTKQFIRRACFLWLPEMGSSSVCLPGAIQQSDLFQIVITRLVENECAVMKAFSGTTEDEWLAYLAAIASSVVCASLRRQGRLKRRGRATASLSCFAESWRLAQQQKRNRHREIEQSILAREVRTLCERMIRNLAGKYTTRNMLIFRLYSLHDLSFSQIAACKGVNLSKSGVEDVITRLKHHVQNVIASEPRDPMREQKSTSICPT